MTRPLFSIIIPVYQASAKLASTLQSVLTQRGTEFECIVVDGGSTDGTIPLLRQHEGQIRWISEPDNGIYDAMNKGIDLALGKYLYFLGAGDVLHPETLKTVSQVLPSEGPAFVYGNVQLGCTGQVHDGLWGKAKFTRGNITHQAIFYDRAIFDLLGHYETTYGIWADCVLNMKCFGDRRIHRKYIPAVIATYEGGGASVTARDLAFERDRPGLIRKHLGVWPYFLFQIESHLPSTWKQGRHHFLKAMRFWRPSHLR